MLEKDEADSDEAMLAANRSDVRTPRVITSLLDEEDEDENDDESAEDEEELPSTDWSEE